MERIYLESDLHMITTPNVLKMVVKVTSDYADSVKVE